MNIKLSKKVVCGFSLIELMTVIAIVSVLATIGTSSYREYINKSIKSESYIMLSAVTTAQKSYYIDRGFFRTFAMRKGYLNFSNMQPLGYPIPDTGNLKFIYYGRWGYTDASASEIVGEVEPLNQAQSAGTAFDQSLAYSSSGAVVECDALYNINPSEMGLVDTEDKGDYFWLLSTATYNFKDDGDNTIKCTNIMQLLERENGSFGTSPMIEVSNE